MKWLPTPDALIYAFVSLCWLAFFIRSFPWRDFAASKPHAKHEDRAAEHERTPGSIQDAGERHDATSQTEKNSQPKWQGVLYWPVTVFLWLLKACKHNEGIITALATVAVTIVAFLQWETLEKTDNTLERANENSRAFNRAYISLEIFDRRWPPLRPDRPEIQHNRISINTKITNNGNTLARDLIYRTAVVRLPAGEKRDPFDLATWKSEGPAVLAPKQDVTLFTDDVLYTEFPEILTGDVMVHVLSWVTYFDAISNPPVPRQTRMSFRLSLDTEGGRSYGWNPTHNCVDDDCPK